MKREMSTFLAGGIIVTGLGLGVLAQSANTNTRTFDELFVQAAASSNAYEIETSRLAGDRASSASIKKYAASMMTMHTRAQQDLNAAASKNAPVASGAGSSGMGSAGSTGTGNTGASTANGSNGSGSTGTGGGNAGTGTGGTNPAQTGTGATSTGGPNAPQGNIGQGNLGSNTATTQASGGAVSLLAMLSPGEQLRVTNLSSLSGATFDRAYVTEQVNAHEGAIAIFRLATKRLSDGNLKSYATKSLPMIQTHLAQIVQISKTLK